MQPHQQRVIDELTELDEKIEKLSDFIGDAIYKGLNETDRFLLAMQLSAMKAYSEILHKRVKRF
ncbi:crAss001_48 related protein [Xenorhabdus bovienii]|uniref:crAss001_48 related protein n=1 Tax=Xenorhabdus bovienii TaxID=40576 RepID=UPI003DA3DA8E